MPRFLDTFAGLRKAVANDTREIRPWWFLVPLGLLSVGAIAVMVSREASWREEPALFAGAALLMGAVFLAGLWVVRSRRIPMAAVLWILSVGVALNVIGTGLQQSDDINRYVVEGQQILAGQNPYQIPPGDPRAKALVPAAISAQVNHPEMTAIYPPVSLLVEAGVQALWPGLRGFTVLACVCALLAIGLALVLMVRLGVPPGLILAVAWNPVLPIFASGEAHNDMVMAVLLLLALTLATFGRAAGAVVAATLAILVKPFAVIALPALLATTGWRRWWLVPVTAVIFYLPFSGAGFGLVSSLLTFGGSMHFHGALDPWIRIGVAWIIPPAQVEVAVRLVLLLVLASGLTWLWLRRGTTTLPTLAVRMLGVLLLCLPTLHPWYFIMVVVLLPFTRSWALALWTASAGVYWLHGLQILATGVWVETLWVTALAHLPALFLIVVEVVNPARELDRPPSAGRFHHA